MVVHGALIPRFTPGVASTTRRDIRKSKNTAPVQAYGPPPGVTLAANTSQVHSAPVATFSNNGASFLAGPHYVGHEQQVNTPPQNREWICPGCANENFKDRTECRTCGTPRVPANFVPDPRSYHRTENWACDTQGCNNDNWAIRTKCNFCPALRPPPPTGEWVCPLCEQQVANFSERCTTRYCQGLRPEESTEEETSDE